jgi:3-isopropylmalate/(R)-2-methylmalate dehydratase large subunit
MLQKAVTAVAYWKTLRTDADAKFDEEINFEASTLNQHTYGTVGMGLGTLPDSKDVVEKETYAKSLGYMGIPTR